MKKKKKKSKENLWDLWEKRTNNIRIVGIPEGEEKGKITKNIFKTIMVIKFLNLERGINIQIQETKGSQIDWTEITLLWDI